MSTKSQEHIPTRRRVKHDVLKASSSCVIVYKTKSRARTSQQTIQNLARYEAFQHLISSVSFPRPHTSFPRPFALAPSPSLRNHSRGSFCGHCPRDMKNSSLCLLLSGPLRARTITGIISPAAVSYSYNRLSNKEIVVDCFELHQ